jgi:phosphate/sulfate permease
MARKHDGIDVAIAAFLGARLSGRSVAEAIAERILAMQSNG